MTTRPTIAHRPHRTTGAARRPWRLHPRLRRSVGLLAILFLAIPSGLLSSCSLPPIASRDTLHNLGQQTGPERYMIGPGDSLRIEFWNMSSLNREVPVPPDGRLNLPLVGEVKVVDQTAADLSSALTKAFSQRIANADVTVTVVRFGSKRVYVWGEVRQPGMIVLDRPMRVTDAISLSGGMTDRAEARRVAVIRLGGPMVYTLDLNELVSGDTEYNIPVLDRDIIYVPRGRF